MTEIAEPVAIGMVDSNDVDCPFDHDNPTPPKTANYLIGSGGKLANKMAKRNSTLLYKEYRDRQYGSGRPEEIKNPRNCSGHPLENKKRVVTIRYREGIEAKEHLYPVTCAAHHLIPAQEALKSSSLLTFMVKKSVPEELKGGSYEKGKVWADVGYDVNGSENGVFLPGSYAVGGGRGGLGLWSGNDDSSDEEDENADEVPDPASPTLEGELNEISSKNWKWLYVSQAMKYAPGQFHDRHEDYSNFVAEVLSKIFSDYVRKYKQSFVENQCPKCKEKKEKIEKDGIPTPFGLVNRLNAVSDRLESLLTGPSWRTNVYTSKWVKAFMFAKKQGHPDAKIGLINEP
jgi:hypothetical protein